MDKKLKDVKMLKTNKNESKKGLKMLLVTKITCQKRQNGCSFYKELKVWVRLKCSFTSLC